MAFVHSDRAVAHCQFVWHFTVFFEKLLTSVVYFSEIKRSILPKMISLYAKLLHTRFLPPEEDPFCLHSSGFCSAGVQAAKFRARFP